MRRLVLALATLAPVRQSVAEPNLVASDVFRYTSRSDLLVDGGIAVGFPTALPTGLSRGVALGFARGRTVAWGARVSWLTATESSMAWTVTHADLRLRATGTLQHAAGRGTIGLRLGLGGTLVHESRERNQGARAGLSGDELATSAYAMVPAGDLEAVIGVHVAGSWLLTLSGGPSLARIDGETTPSWGAQLGIGWQR